MLIICLYGHVRISVTVGNGIVSRSLCLLDELLN
jgi:hypothetical protein